MPDLTEIYLLYSWNLFLFEKKMNWDFAFGKHQLLYTAFKFCQPHLHVAEDCIISHQSHLNNMKYDRARRSLCGSTWELLLDCLIREIRQGFHYILHNLVYFILYISSQLFGLIIIYCTCVTDQWIFQFIY